MTKTSSATPDNQTLETAANGDLLQGKEGDNISLGNAEFSTATGNVWTGTAELQLGLEQEALSVHDLITDHTTTDSTGGYLHFSVNGEVVTLGLDLSSPSGSENHTLVTLATIEGASGLSATQIMNSLLAHHEIKFD